MAVTLEIGDIAAWFALGLSAFATWKTLKFNKRQQSLIEGQQKLNDLLLSKEESGAISDQRADLSASFIKLGNNKTRLKIWNKGKAAARNVQIKFPDGNDVLIQSEINEKFPLEILEPHHSVELIAAVFLGTRAKHIVQLVWADDFDEDNEKTVYLTL